MRGLWKVNRRHSSVAGGTAVRVETREWPLPPHHTAGHPQNSAENQEHLAASPERNLSQGGGRGLRQGHRWPGRASTPDQMSLRPAA